MRRSADSRSLPLSVFCLLLTACSAAQPIVRTPALVDETREQEGAFEIVLATERTRDCDAEHNECFEHCWNSPPPDTHIERGKAGHYKYCTSLCLKKYMECCKQQELKPRAFPNMKTALDWLKEHKTEVMVGSILVVAGTAFVVSTGGAGALVLLPLAAI